MASHIAMECMSVENMGMGVNYGLDRVRFTNAVPVNARIRGRMELLTYEAIPNGAKYKMLLTIELEGSEKPACVAEWIGVGYTR